MHSVHYAAFMEGSAVLKMKGCSFTATSHVVSIPSMHTRTSPCKPQLYMQNCCIPGPSWAVPSFPECVYDKHTGWSDLMTACPGAHVSELGAVDSPEAALGRPPKAPVLMKGVVASLQVAAISGEDMLDLCNSYSEGRDPADLAVLKADAEQMRASGTDMRGKPVDHSRWVAGAFVLCSTVSSCASWISLVSRTTYAAISARLHGMPDGSPVALCGSPGSATCLAFACRRAPSQVHILSEKDYLATCVSCCRDARGWEGLWRESQRETNKAVKETEYAVQ